MTRPSLPHGSQRTRTGGPATRPLPLQPPRILHHPRISSLCPSCSTHSLPSRPSTTISTSRPQPSNRKTLNTHHWGAGGSRTWSSRPRCWRRSCAQRCSHRRSGRRCRLQRRGCRRACLCLFATQYEMRLARGLLLGSGSLLAQSGSVAGSRGRGGEVGREKRTFVTPLRSENDAHALLRRRYAHCVWLGQLVRCAGAEGLGRTGAARKARVNESWARLRKLGRATRLESKF